MSELLDRVRFRPEHKLIDELFDRYGLEQLIQHRLEQYRVAPDNDRPGVFPAPLPLVSGSSVRHEPREQPRN